VWRPKKRRRPKKEAKKGEAKKGDIQNNAALTTHRYSSTSRARRRTAGAYCSSRKDRSSRCEELVAADSERSHEIDGPCPKASLEIVALLAVTQLAEPVDDLAVTMIELGRPLARALLSLSPEQALRFGFLEFDEVVTLASLNLRQPCHS
jgi:hypothetical protein